MSIGKIVKVIGAVVDVEFEQGKGPKVYDALKINDGSNGSLMLEVQQQLGGGVVRCIAMGSSDGLKRDLEVESTGNPITVPVGEETLGRIMNVLGTQSMNVVQSVSKCLTKFTVMHQATKSNLTALRYWKRALKLLT